MFPTQYHSRDRRGWYISSDQPHIPLYAGGSLLAPGEVLRESDLKALRGGRAWVVTSSSGWGGWGLYVPPRWKKLGDERFPEVYAFQNDVRVICYEIPK